MLKDLQKFAKQVIKMFMAFILATLLCSCFALAYKHTSKHIPSDGETDYKWEANALTTTMMEGYAFLRMDSNGFNNIRVYNEPDILILGSSHIEAMQMPTKFNAASLLNGLLPYNTYAIGISDHTLCRCVSNYSKAVKHYQPRRYTVIETCLVNPPINEMTEVITNKDRPRKTPYTGIKALVQFVPAAKVIFNQLLQWATLETEKNFSQNLNPIQKVEQNRHNAQKTYDKVGISNDIVPKNTVKVGGIKLREVTLPSGYIETLKQFLSIVSNVAKANGITPIIFYHPSEKLNYDGTIAYQTDPIYLNCFASVCSNLGIVFIDMTDSFKQLYAEKNQLAHGFINSGVGSGHLNQHGHRVIAEKLADVIQRLETE